MQRQWSLFLQCTFDNTDPVLRVMPVGINILWVFPKDCFTEATFRDPLADGSIHFAAGSSSSAN